MKISLIVATYNRPDMLELVLLSIARQQINRELRCAEIEVLIADDGSGSATAELIERYQGNFPWRLTHVWHPDQGFRLAAIRNLAVSRSSGDYLLFIDGDCLLADDFVANQVALAEPGYFVAGNRVLISEKYSRQIFTSKDISVAARGQLAAIWACLSGKTNKLLPALRLSFTAGWRKKNATNWRRPKGCNIAVYRGDYYRVNGFDEEFSGWGHEDADFFIRLLHAGVLIKDGRFAAPVYHLWHKTNDRSHEAENMARLVARMADRQIIRAKQGIDKYFCPVLLTEDTERCD